MWVERVGVIHVHSRYSDGRGTMSTIVRAARGAQLDFVLVTDHNTLAGRERGHGGWHGPTLVLVGQEISPDDGNHFLAFGLDHVVAPASPPQTYVRAVQKAGGLGFIAHPHYPEASRYPLRPYPWRDWRVQGYTGLEIWNYTVDWLTDVTRVGPLLAALANPDRFVNGPPEPTLAQWDRLAAAAWRAGRRVVGIGGADAHGLLYSYRRMFRQVRTHLLLAADWYDHGAKDEALVLDALAEGRAFVAYDGLRDATGFQFFAEGPAGQVPMGGIFTLERDAWLVARAPAPCQLTLCAAEGRRWQVDGTQGEFRLAEPGVYRVEARLPSRRGWRPWVFTNPIYVR